MACCERCVQEATRNIKKRSCDVVGEWSPSISNHLYWCAASSNGNGDLISQKWLSILNNVVDVHEGHGDLYPRCLHGPLDDRDWLKQGSKAYVELEAVVKGKLLVNDIQKLSHIGQTSSLESFHKVVCAFAPKAVHFFFKQMQARLFLAAMHFNENSSRQQSMTKDGNKQYAVSYPKGRGGEGVAKEVKVDQTFNYIADLMDALVELRELNDSYTKARDAIDRHVQVPPPIAQSTPKPPKDVTIQRHTTRFN